MMNRSAQDGKWSSLHYGGEGVGFLPSYQGVCGRHGVEETCVTQGDLVLSEGKVWSRYCDTRRRKGGKQGTQILT